MKIVSWNVAGIRACLKKGLSEFFKDVDADIFCMQEVKAMENQFDFRPDGYTMYFYIQQNVRDILVLLFLVELNLFLLLMELAIWSMIVKVVILP